MSFKNVLLVDQSVPDYQVFLDSVNVSTCAVLYSSTTTRDELYSMIRSKTNSVERFGIVFIKNEMFVERHSFLQSKDLLVSLVRDFNTTHLDFLACNTLRNPKWKHLYDSLEQETGVVIGASSDRTGNLNYGGDWVMENTNENIETIYFTNAIEYYKYLLDYSVGSILYVKQGILYAYGNNDSGQAGMATPTFLSLPTAVPFVDSSGNSLVSNIKQINYGYGHTIITLTDGTVWGSGYNEDYELGLGDQVNRTNFTLLNISNVSQVSCGGYHTIVLKNDGTLWGTGYNYNYVLGLNDRNNRTTFTQLNISDVVQVSCNWAGTIVVKNDRTLWGTGGNILGELGLGDTVDRPTFTQLNLSDVAYVSCGENHTVVLKNNGTLWGTGYNLDGELGLGDTVNRTTFTQLNITDVDKVICGGFITTVIKNDGTLWGTGNNFNGELGLGDTVNRTTFTQLNIFNVSKVLGGDSHTAVLKNDGTLWATGAFSNWFAGDERVSSLTFGLIDSQITYPTSSVQSQPQLQSPTIQPWSITNNSTTRRIRLTSPVSNSPAPFTYTTSDSSIATIEGDYLTLYRASSVTITATQLATDVYLSASTSVTMNLSYFTFITDICFTEGTPILTDQGIFPIETLTTQTLGSKPIIRITKTLGTEEQLVCFEKDSLGKDHPSQKTVMTQKHRLEKDGNMVKAIECVNGESIHLEWYMGEYLYNVLLDEPSFMTVNGLICETLDPENDVAKFYKD